MDEWIDQALSTYTDAEPRPGMEQRILARASASKTRFAPWLLVPAVACLVWAVVTLIPMKRPTPDILMALPRARSGADVAMAPLVQTPRRHARPAPLPKRNTFPEPAPPPDPELDLARLARDNPQFAAGLLEWNAGEPAPIQVDPLSIKPLDEN
jgi:hypothetical protein